MRPQRVDWWNGPTSLGDLIRRRDVAISGLILIEVVLLAIVSAGKYHHLGKSPDPLLRSLVWLPLPVKATAAGVVLLLIFAALRGAARRAPAPEARRARLLPWLTVNMASVLALAAILQIFDHSWSVDRWLGSPALSLFLLTPLLWLVVAVSWAALAVASTGLEGAAGRRSLLAASMLQVTLAAAFFLDAGLAARVGAFMLPATLALVQIILSFAGHAPEVFKMSADGFPIVGTLRFSVEINPPCAGYQGVLLTIVLLSFCLRVFRPAITPLRIAAVLLTSAAALYLLNAIRIALLIVIGSTISPEIAVDGFHTNFGLLSAVTVSLAALGVMLRPACGAKAERMDGDVPFLSDDLLRDVVLLLPLTALLAVSLIAGLMTGEFNWLYPLPVAAAAVALFAIRDHLLHDVSEASAVSLLAGIAGFALWIALVPEDAAKGAAFEETLFSAPLWIAGSWLLARILGSVVVVPLAEELAFRGFGMKAAITFMKGRLPAPWPAVGALLGTSLAYGAVHGDMLAATAVGLVYGSLRLLTGRSWDAVIAHAVTNTLLALHVLLFSAWSYWG